MTRLERLGLAGALAAAVLAPTLTTAAAGEYKDWRHKHHNYYSYGWNPGSAFVAGTVLGLGFGAFASPYYYYPPPPPPLYYAPYPPPSPYPARYSDNAHIDWCSATYRSYNAESDTWVDFNGVVHQCVGPY